MYKMPKDVDGNAITLPSGGQRTYPIGLSTMPMEGVLQPYSDVLPSQVATAVNPSFVNNTKRTKTPASKALKSNQDILNFQQWAINKGYAPKGAKADGVLGPQTRQMINASGMEELLRNGRWDGSTGMKLAQGAAISDYGNQNVNQDGRINANNLNAVADSFSVQKMNDGKTYVRVPRQDSGNYVEQMAAMRQQAPGASLAAQAPARREVPDWAMGTIFEHTGQY